MKKLSTEDLLLQVASKRSKTIVRIHHWWERMELQTINLILHNPPVQTSLCKQLAIPTLPTQGGRPGQKLLQFPKNKLTADIYAQTDRYKKKNGATKKVH